MLTLYAKHGMTNKKDKLVLMRPLINISELAVKALPPAMSKSCPLV